MRNMLASLAVILLGAAPALANDWGNPSTDWSGHSRFNSANQDQANLNRADMIKREEGGYYGQWNQTSITNNYGDTNIENMHSSTAIGSQVVTEVNIVGDNNNVDQDATGSASTEGNTDAGIWTNESASSSNYYNN